MNHKIEGMLKNYKKLGRISFSMPGHKNALDFSGLADVTELYDTDNLHNPSKEVKAAMENISDIFSSDSSLIMVNGSTGGIFTMLGAVCKRGDKVLVSRITHMSVINACVVMGLEPIFFEHKIYNKYSIYKEADIEDLKSKLSKHKVKAVMVTSPNYYGAVSDIKSIAHILKERKIPLLVDEAHGCHFFVGDFFPETAIKSGCDMAVQSVHKTLNGLNQSAILHIKSDLIDKERVMETAAFFQTSSPSYPIVASCEAAVIDAMKNSSGWENLYNICMDLKKKLTKDTRIRIPEKSDGFFDLDETRLVFNFAEYEITGNEVSDILRERYNIDIEMSDEKNIVLIPTPSNCDKDFEVLEQALKEICAETKKRKTATEKNIMVGMPELIMMPSEAFYADWEWIDLNESEDRVSARTVTIYPPGMAILLPGSKIDKESINFLSNCKGDLIGINDGKIKVVKGEETD